jgi:hypothetical protein
MNIAIKPEHINNVMIVAAKTATSSNLGIVFFGSSGFSFRRTKYTGSITTNESTVNNNMIGTKVCMIHISTFLYYFTASFKS